MAFVTPVMEHWLEREIAQWVHNMKDRSDDPSHQERTLLPQSYISLQFNDSHFSQAIISIIFSCTFDLFGPILEKENVIENCTLYCLVLLNSLLFLNLFVQFNLMIFILMHFQKYFY